MIPPEAILEASATMIVGILFIVTLARAIGIEQDTARFMLFFCLFGVIPFSIAAVLALLELTEAARWVCIAAFLVFAFLLTFALWAIMGVKEEIERLREGH